MAVAVGARDCSAVKSSRCLTARACHCRRLHGGANESAPPAVDGAPPMSRSNQHTTTLKTPSSGGRLRNYRGPPPRLGPCRLGPAVEVRPLAAAARPAESDRRAASGSLSGNWLQVVDACRSVAKPLNGKRHRPPPRAHGTSCSFFSRARARRSSSAVPTSVPSIFTASRSSLRPAARQRAVAGSLLLLLKPMDIVEPRPGREFLFKRWIRERLNRNTFRLRRRPGGGGRRGGGGREPPAAAIAAAATAASSTPPPCCSPPAPSATTSMRSSKARRRRPPAPAAPPRAAAGDDDVGLVARAAIASIEAQRRGGVRRRGRRAVLLSAETRAQLLPLTTARGVLSRARRSAARSPHADELELRHEGGAADVAHGGPPDADAPPLRIATLDRVRLRSILRMLLASRRRPTARRDGRRRGAVLRILRLYALLERLVHLALDRLPKRRSPSGRERLLGLVLEVVDRRLLAARAGRAASRWRGTRDRTRSCGRVESLMKEMSGIACSYSVGTATVPAGSSRQSKSSCTVSRTSFGSESRSRCCTTLVNFGAQSWMIGVPAGTGRMNEPNAEGALARAHVDLGELGRGAASAGQRAGDSGPGG